MNQFIKYVGLDTHKDTIAVAIADAMGSRPRFYGEMFRVDEYTSQHAGKDCPARNRNTFSRFP